jgi:nucleotide-binding universal stress UspA family protein
VENGPDARLVVENAALISVNPCPIMGAENRIVTFVRGAAMYKNLLIATDGTKLSDKALAHAIGLAQAVGAKLTVFYAAPDYPMPAYADGVVYEPVTRREYTKLASADAQKILDAASAKAESAGIDCKTSFSIAAAPWEAILAAARKHKSDAIVMASHGRRGLSAVLLGSETQKVLTHSKLPVIVVR